MQVWRSPSGRITVISPVGELDFASVDELRENLLSACVDSRLVLVDLLAVTFLESMTLGVLVGAMKRCRAQGSQLLVMNAQGICRRVLLTTGLGSLLGETHAPGLVPDPLSG